MPSTRWVDHLTPQDAEVDGRQQPVYVGVGFDGNVGLDLSANVAKGAELSTLATRLLQLPTTSETAYRDMSDLLIGAPSATGESVVVQRVAGMSRDRVYRLEVDFGPAGNRHTESLLIAVAE